MMLTGYSSKKNDQILIWNLENMGQAKERTRGPQIQDSLVR